MVDSGLVIVSHSKHIAQGVVDLIRQVAQDVLITFVGGTEDGGIGSSFEQVQAAIEDNPKTHLLAFYDLGSAHMNLEMAKEFSEKDIAIQDVPLVEGAYTAAALLQVNTPLEEITKQLADLTIPK